MATSSSAERRPRLGPLCAAWAITALLAGCDGALDLMRSAQTKRDLAFAPTAHMLAQRDALARTLAEPLQRTRFEAGFDERVAQRALRCVGDRPITRYTRTADLRRYATGEDCQGDSSALTDWLGQHRVAHALRQPAARPARPLGALRRSGLMPGTAVHHLVFSAEADVALLVGSEGRLLLMTPSDAKALRELAGPTHPLVAPLLSPNGRLAALPIGEGQWRVVDTESGSAIWSPGGFGHMLAWLPAQAGLLATDALDGRVLLVDLYSGRRQALQEPAPGPAWCWPDAAAKDAWWIGGQREVVLMQFERNAAVVSGRRLRGQGLGSLVATGPDGLYGPPIVLQDRWWLGHGWTSLNVLDLKAPNPRIEALAFMPGFEGPVAMLDGRALLHEYGTPGGETWTIVDPVQGRRPSMKPSVTGARLVPLSGRTGFALLGAEALWYGDRLDTSDATTPESR